MSLAKKLAELRKVTEDVGLGAANAKDFRVTFNPAQVLRLIRVAEIADEALKRYESWPRTERCQRCDEGQEFAPCSCFESMAIDKEAREISAEARSAMEKEMGT